MEEYQKEIIKRRKQKFKQKLKPIITFLLGGLLMFIYLIMSLTNNLIVQLISSLFVPLIIFPRYIANVIANLTIKSIFDPNSFWVVSGDIFNKWVILFIIIGGIYFLILLKCLFNKNVKIKGRCLWFLFIFNLIMLITRAYLDYKNFGSKNGLLLTLGSGNEPLFMKILIMLIFSIFILNGLYPTKINLKFIKISWIKYILYIFKIFLVVFIGMLFLEIKSNITPKWLAYLNLFLWYSCIFFIGYIFYLVLDLLENFLNKKL